MQKSISSYSHSGSISHSVDYSMDRTLVSDNNLEKTFSMDSASYMASIFDGYRLESDTIDASTTEEVSFQKSKMNSNSCEKVKSEVNVNNSFNSTHSTELDPVAEPSHEKIVEFEGHKVVLESVDVLESWKLKLQCIACFLCLFISGMMDQSLGSNIENLVSYYDSNRTKVSSILICQCVGCLSYVGLCGVIL
ncbi:unnamed protein product [Ambrosiozyma monospora]|uniref:Unnamed protein product n=1 Tax=Ambrosiozyma monospora TaxID=43982 RepID=A0ACB5TP99_AMBMO|nr:unnamed protein product [Ambrosiozyma monospora]